MYEFSGRGGPFLAVNCAALPEQLAEGELFGYRRGAFTGAQRPSPGYFRSAHGGTLFLDEMPELSLPLQAKLLRVIEDGKVVGLGETSSVDVDVRIVSSSHKPLAELVARKRLREDLAAAHRKNYFHLKVGHDPLVHRSGRSEGHSCPRERLTNDHHRPSRAGRPVNSGAGSSSA
ncbi:MAG TPA: sigma 54-interacting transcriptional regulator [Polyangiaceae bacterium]|nr:sigma 54-interacting transcriptional regulator [Polyangiaceae bacterium]